MLNLYFAFCVGLAKEALIVEKIFLNHGFEIVSVVCKAGRELKQDIGIDNKDYVMPNTQEAMCNPTFHPVRIRRPTLPEYRFYESGYSDYNRDALLYRLGLFLKSV